MWTSELFPTQLCGSYVKPRWLADHDKVYAREGAWWRIPEPQLGEALDDSQEDGLEVTQECGGEGFGAQLTSATVPPPWAAPKRLPTRTGGK